MALVKAFLKAGIFTELGDKQDTPAGTPQGGILSPLMANIALSVLDEHLHRPWQPGGAMSTRSRRERRRAKGLPNWRIVRYADLCGAPHKATYVSSRIMRRADRYRCFRAGFRFWARHNPGVLVRVRRGMP